MRSTRSVSQYRPSALVIPEEDEDYRYQQMDSSESTGSEKVLLDEPFELNTSLPLSNRNAGDDYTVGSTRMGDSFIRDWDTSRYLPSSYDEARDDDYVHIREDDQNNDPYLQSIPEMRRRRLQRQQQQRVFGETDASKAMNVQTKETNQATLNVRLAVQRDPRREDFLLVADSWSPNSVMATGNFDCSTLEQQYESWTNDADDHERCYGETTYSEISGETANVVGSHRPLHIDIILPNPKLFEEINDYSGCESDDASDAFVLDQGHTGEPSLVIQWQQELDRTNPNHGLKRANILLHLGLSQSAIGALDEAVQSLGMAIAHYRQLRKFLPLSQALEHIGIVYCQLGKWDASIRAMKKALTLRMDHLGKWHVDTVATLQNIGHVYYVANQFEMATQCYWESFWVYQAIFGSSHPIVADAAYALAKALMRRSFLRDAENFYLMALDTYDNANIPETDNKVRQVLREYKRLQRIQRWCQGD